MTVGSPGPLELPPEPARDVTAGEKRVLNLALGHQIAARLSLSRPVRAAELTAIRSAVDDHFEKATAGITAVDEEGGWTAEESLEQHGLRIAMEMMIAGMTPLAATPPINPTAQPGYLAVCGDEINPEAETPCAAKSAQPRGGNHHA